MEIANRGLNTCIPLDHFEVSKFIFIFALTDSARLDISGKNRCNMARDLKRQDDSCEPYGSGSHALPLLPG